MKITLKSCFLHEKIKLMLFCMQIEAVYVITLINNTKYVHH